MEKFKKVFKNFLIYSLSLGSIGVVVWWLWKNPIYNPAGPQFQNTTSQIEVRFRDAVVKGRKNGVPYWTVYCKNVESERNSSMIFFKDNPNGEFYNMKDWSKTDLINQPSGTQTQNERLRTFKWNANLAEYNTEAEDLSLKKNVVMITDDKDKIITEELHWNNSEQKAVSNTRTKIISHKGHPIISADNIEGDMRLDILNLKGNVEIDTVMNDEQQL